MAATVDKETKQFLLDQVSKLNAKEARTYLSKLIKEILSIQLGLSTMDKQSLLDQASKLSPKETGAILDKIMEETLSVQLGLSTMKDFFDRTSDMLEELKNS